MIGPLLLAAFAVGLWAHPLGKFSVSHFAHLTVGPDNLQVRYVVDMAEISTFQELERIDTDGDHSFSKTEYDAYAERTGKQLADNLTITVDGLRVPLQVRERKVAVPSGDGGLPLLSATSAAISLAPALARHDTCVWKIPTGMTAAAGGSWW